MYVFESIDGTASIVYDESMLDEITKQRGILVQFIEEPMDIEGKYSILMCNADEKKIWYEYFDILYNI